jgi:hypothetical protein
LDSEKSTSLGPDWLERSLGGSGLLVRAGQSVLALAGVFGLILAQATEHPAVLIASVAVVVAAGMWVMLGAILRRRRPKAVSLPPAPVSSSYLRGLLPFEKTDHLLGREQEAGQLLTLVRSLEFRFGFLSGEAGAGKTSLIRAKLISGLNTDGWHPVYVPRTGPDPIASLRKAILASASFDQPAPIEASLTDLLRWVSESLSGKVVVLILDQFEEYFVSTRSRRDRAVFETQLHELAVATTGDLKVRILFAIRKEFVDDLLDLSRSVPPLQNTRWRQPLRNLTSDTARELLRTITIEEKLRFSDDLQDSVIADIARDGRVRPVEFQIVLTSLLDRSVFSLPGYRTLGGSQGIIASFVRDIIDPSDFKIDEVERQVARHLLRMLCSKDFATRRPEGLSPSELSQQILQNMQITDQLSIKRTQIDVAIGCVIRRCVDSYILIQEDNTHFNLAHDYLASPIRDATADIETVEERADRLLSQYLEQSRAGQNVILSWKTMRFLKRFANRERLKTSGAKLLIRRSLMRYGALLSGAAVTALVPLTLLLPLAWAIQLTKRRY